MELSVLERFRRSFDKHRMMYWHMALLYIHILSYERTHSNLISSSMDKINIDEVALKEFPHNAKLIPHVIFYWIWASLLEFGNIWTERGIFTTQKIRQSSEWVRRHWGHLIFYGFGSVRSSWPQDASKLYLLLYEHRTLLSKQWCRIWQLDCLTLFIKNWSYWNHERSQKLGRSFVDFNYTVQPAPGT